MSEKGRVKDIRDGMALVELEENSGCSSCRMCRREPGGMALEVEAPAGLQRGQTVVVEGAGSTWAASILLFLVPLADMLIGVVLGQFFQPFGLSPDAASTIFGLGFFAISFAGAMIWEKRLRRKPGNKPRIVTFYDGL